MFDNIIICDNVASIQLIHESLLSLVYSGLIMENFSLFGTAVFWPIAHG